MEIIFDQEKNRINIEKHGLSFDLVQSCDWSDPVIFTDDRNNYGEIRYNAFVLLDARLHNVVFTNRDENMRVISFRKANLRERKKYEKIH